MRIAKLRQHASRMTAILKKWGREPAGNDWTSYWREDVARPIQEFGHEFQAALRDGTVGDHRDFWQKFVNGVIEKVASEETVVRRIAGLGTLFAQVSYLAGEVSEFATTPVVNEYNRYQLVLAVCETLKTAGHPKL